MRVRRSALSLECAESVLLAASCAVWFLFLLFLGDPSRAPSHSAVYLCQDQAVSGMPHLRVTSNESQCH